MFNTECGEENSVSNELILTISWVTPWQADRMRRSRDFGRNSPSLSELRVVNVDGTGGCWLIAEAYMVRYGHQTENTLFLVDCKRV